MARTTALTAWALLLLRVVIAIIFLKSGWSHAKDPAEQAKSIEVPVWFTLLLGLGELAGVISIALGILTQIGALILMVVMLGAIGMKAFKWDTGFFKGQTGGWHYDLLIFAGCLVIFATAGGRLTLFP